MNFFTSHFHDISSLFAGRDGLRVVPAKILSSALAIKSLVWMMTLSVERRHCIYEYIHCIRRETCRSSLSEALIKTTRMRRLLENSRLLSSTVSGQVRGARYQRIKLNTYYVRPPKNRLRCSRFYRKCLLDDILALVMGRIDFVFISESHCGRSLFTFFVYIYFLFLFTVLCYFSFCFLFHISLLVKQKLCISNGNLVAKNVEQIYVTIHIYVFLSPLYDNPVSWVSRRTRLHLFRVVRLHPTSVLDIKPNNLMVRLQ